MQHLPSFASILAVLLATRHASFNCILPAPYTQFAAPQSAQFSSVQDGIYELGQDHMRSTRLSEVSLTLPLKQFQCSSGPLSTFQRRSSSASSFHASLLQAFDGVMSLDLWPQVVSQASQHFRSSEKQVTCEGCFALQSVCFSQLDGTRSVCNLTVRDRYVT